MTEKTKPCPMPHTKCTDCQGYIADGMKCNWGYTRSYEEPPKLKGEDREYTTKW